MTESVEIEAEPMERTGAKILDVVSARVADVGNELARLDQLLVDASNHQAEIDRLVEEKVRVIDDRNMDKQQRINKVTKLLSSLEIENADLARKKNEIAGHREHIREIGITARSFAAHICDHLRLSRLNRSEAFVSEFFYQTPLSLPAKDVAKLSNLVREIDLLSHGLHPQPNLEAELTALRGLAEKWSVIRGLCEQEPQFAPQLPANWL